MTNNSRRQFIAGAAGLVAGALGVGVWNRINRVPPGPVDDDDDSAFPSRPIFGQHYGGRIEDRPAAEAVRSTFPTKYFGDTPAGKAKLGAEPKTVLLSDAALSEFGGKHLPVRNQGSVGSCVSFGTAAAVEYLMLVEKAAGAALDFCDLAQEIIYGGSRVEVGGGKIRGDGSVGAWAAKFVNEWGVICRSKNAGGKYDLSTYSEARCREYGKKGVPDDLEPLAKESPVKGITSIRSADEAAKALIQGYPLAVCSDQGFEGRGGSVRDKEGFLKAGGQWQHCMAVIGYTDKPRRGFLILNSWGDRWLSGPKGEHDIPDGSFWCEWSTFDRMARQNDTWAFSEATGFPAKDPFWIF